MIKTLKIENFKSIQKEILHFEPLTVIVGANGSGKSNLVKAFDFIGSIPTIGLSNTVNKFGGFRALVPKALPKKEIRKTKLCLSFDTIISSPPNYKSNWPEISINYCLEIKKPSDAEAIRVLKEILTFNEVLAVLEILHANENNIDIDEIDYPGKLKLSISRGPKKGRNYLWEPDIINISAFYRDWLGLFLGKDEIDFSKRDLKNVFHFLTNKEKLKHYQSFLDPNAIKLFNFSLQASAFRSTLIETRRFDFLLSKLRSEQPHGDTRKLSSSGDNLASILRGLLGDPKKSDSFERILTTFSLIAPNITKINPNSLRTGKEFIEFVEANTENPVESWESSDGILRTLAILLALETQNSTSTLLIEEPELNLHPWAIKPIIDHIREIIEIKNIQVILTTHSQQVLENVNAEEVLFTQRDKFEGTKFLKLNQILPDKKLIMGEIGELWVRGLLGGVPGYE